MISNMIVFLSFLPKKLRMKKTYRWSPKESHRCVKKILRTSLVTEKKKSYIIYIITQQGNKKRGGKDGKRGEKDGKQGGEDGKQGGENRQRGKIKCADFAS